MNKPRTLRLFLASSEELREDRKEFEIFINRKNKLLNKDQIFIELIIWEDFLDAMSQSRLQDVYNRVIRDCDIFVMLFFTKVGRYTREEFETAFGRFKETNRPLIYTYFKDAPVNTGVLKRSDQTSLWDFQDKLSELGHFWTKYQNIDDLKYQFGEQLDKLLIIDDNSNILIEKKVDSRFDQPVKKNEEESILTAGINDRASEEDALGFNPYVEAIAEFLTDDDTSPPLVLSIEGKWGSGKSSFMLQLQKKLQVEKKQKTIFFNAWRHDNEEALWAAFALEVIRKLSAELSIFQRWIAHFRLQIRRFNWKGGGWLEFLRAIVLFLLFALITIAIPIVLFSTKSDWISIIIKENNNQWFQRLTDFAITSGGLISYVALILSLIIKLKAFIKSSLAIDLNKYIQKPSYSNRISFIEQFHEDFKNIVEEYAGKNKKVYVFIDDLDRCETPKAADLIQALNLMITDAKQLIFIVGMDREKIAATIAAKHQNIISYLYECNNHIKTSGLEYGYSCIEKFIQLPFRVPQPINADFETLLNQVIKSNKKNEASATSENLPDEKYLTPNFIPKPLEIEDRKNKVTNDQLLKLTVAIESPTIRNIILQIAPSLDFNPRLLKQFLNLFRLRIFIAYKTKLFLGGEKTSLTLHQLGKFVAISLKWPLLISDLETDHHLLMKLEKIALGKSLDEIEKTDPVEYWSKRQKLIELLRIGMADGNNSDSVNTYSFSNLDVSTLLQISPYI